MDVILRGKTPCGRLRLERDGTRAETRFRLSPKRTSPFKSAGASVQSTAGSRGVCISVSNAGFCDLIAIQGVSRLVDITAGGDFLDLCDQKSSYKHVSDFGRLRSYDRLKLRIEGNDY